MKILLALLIGGCFSHAQAQRLKPSQVPKAVIGAFRNEHFPANDMSWSRSENNYEADYDTSKADRSVTFDAKGALVETKLEMAISTFPTKIGSYLAQNHNDLGITRASVITKVNGTVSYRVKAKGTHLIFDARGTFIESQEDCSLKLIPPQPLSNVPALTDN